jgi:hypothetical protein
LEADLADRIASVTAIIALAALGFATDIKARQRSPTMTAPIYKELGPITEAPGSNVLTEGTTTLSGSLYTITLNSFEIAGTRSLQNDTDFVSMAVAVGRNAPITLPTKSMGELSNGTYQVSLSIPNLDVSAKEAMAFSYAIFNSGYDKNAIEQTLETEVALAAKTAAAAGSRAAGEAIGAEVGQEIGNFVGSTAGGWLIEKIDRIIFDNCDGSVAAGDHVYSGAQLAYQTARGQVISATDNNGGISSPRGCGSDSHYYVTWSIVVHSKPPPSIKN